MHVHSSPRAKAIRYLRSPEPIVFPVEARVPETKRHLELRTALYEVLKLAFAEVAWIGSDQFVYWDPTDPAACLSPDVFVRRGGPDELFDTWKVWERGAPHLAIEIVSRDDAAATVTEKKLRSYHRSGIDEVVRFDADDGSLRIWDRVDGDLVERALEPGQAAECQALGLWFVVRTEEMGGFVLRLSRDAQGRELLPTPDDARRVAEDQRRVALERVKELEAELAKRGG